MPDGSLSLASPHIHCHRHTHTRAETVCLFCTGQADRSGRLHRSRHGLRPPFRPPAFTDSHSVSGSLRRMNGSARSPHRALACAIARPCPCRRSYHTAQGKEPRNMQRPIPCPRSYRRGCEEEARTLCPSMALCRLLSNLKLANSLGPRAKHGTA